MIDKELAERVRRILGPTFTLDNDIQLLNFRDEYVIDHPIVAMALMERCKHIHAMPAFDGGWAVAAKGPNSLQIDAHSDSLPRAIVEACVTALSA